MITWIIVFLLVCSACSQDARIKKLEKKLK